jgi:hypothetical protein
MADIVEGLAGSGSNFLHGQAFKEGKFQSGALYLAQPFECLLQGARRLENSQRLTV